MRCSLHVIRQIVYMSGYVQAPAVLFSGKCYFEWEAGWNRFRDSENKNQWGSAGIWVTVGQFTASISTDVLVQLKNVVMMMATPSTHGWE